MSKSTICSHSETIRRLGKYTDEGELHWIRIMEITVHGETPRHRYRIDFEVSGIPNAWSVSLDGFASLGEAVAYAAMTAEVDWKVAPDALANRECSPGGLVAWYSHKAPARRAA
jgi:hypothetical protein